MCEDEVTGLESLAALGAVLFAHVEPDAVLSRAPRVVFERDNEGYCARIPLPGAKADELDVAVVEDDLVITTGSRRRALKLPRRMTRLPVTRAKLEGGRLVVRFGSERTDVERFVGASGAGER